MAVIKAMTSGGKRRALDFYPTPREATLALLPLIKHWPRHVFEPCCGDGSISKILEAEGYVVTSQDLADHGYGETGRDFFSDYWPLYPGTIITNPPFCLADEFIRHAHAIGTTKMALILKINFWNASTERRVTWERWKPYLVCPLTWRLDFTGAGRPHTDCMWCLWDRAFDHVRTIYQPIHKPINQNNEIREAA